MTPRQQSILSFIKSYSSEKGYPPAYRDIMEHEGFTSPNAVRGQLKVLESKGYIEIDAKVSRGIRVL